MIKRKYQKTVVDGELFLEDTGNQYIVISQRPYTDKKGRLPSGVLLSLQITHDSSQYKNGEENMQMYVFDAYVLSGSHDVGLKKGDRVSLHDFLPEHSYYIDYQYILRFKGVKKIEAPKK